jgi:hypothetical protein
VLEDSLKTKKGTLSDYVSENLLHNILVRNLERKDSVEDSGVGGIVP